MVWTSSVVQRRGKGFWFFHFGMVINHPLEARTGRPLSSRDGCTAVPLFWISLFSVEHGRYAPIYCMPDPWEGSFTSCFWWNPSSIPDILQITGVRSNDGYKRWGSKERAMTSSLHPPHLSLNREPWGQTSCAVPLSHQRSDYSTSHTQCLRPSVHPIWSLLLYMNNLRGVGKSAARTTLWKCSCWVFL